MRNSRHPACPSSGPRPRKTTTVPETPGAPRTCCSPRCRLAFCSPLRAIARLSRLEFTALELDASGTVNRQDGVTRFTEIVLRPRLTVAFGTDRERALHVLEKSEKTCLVSASLSTPIRLELEITEG